MKSNRTATSMRVVLLTTILVASSLALPPLAAANQPSTLPKTNSFESLTVGSSIIDSDGWYGKETYYATVTNWDISAWSSTNSCGFPIPSATHDKVIRLDTESGSVSNAFGGTSGNTNVVIDSMIQFVPSPDEDAQGIITNDSKIQAAYYLNTNGNLVLYHTRIYWTPDYPKTNVFTVIPTPIISSNSWTRLRIKMDYKTDQEGYFSYYQISVNGTLISNLHAFVDNAHPQLEDPQSGGSDQTGTWFVAANVDSASAFISAVSLNGTGYFDDFVAFGDSPPPWIVTVTYNDARGGYIDPSGPIFVLRGESTNFTVVTSSYWANTSLLSNGVPLVPVVSTVNFNNVTANHTLHAVFTPFRTTNGVPHWWMAQQNVLWTDTNQFNAYASQDYDNDGLTSFQEWLAGTLACDSNSVLDISLSTMDNINFSLDWSCDSYDSDLEAFPYLVQRSTNLVGGTWDTIHAEPRSIGAKSWTDSLPPADVGKAFYRLAVTNSN